jgi:Asp-tRNA(Asn)/Glu-tRNA(Gln) amidotransferase A subunit family amidase
MSSLNLRDVVEPWEWGFTEAALALRLKRCSATELVQSTLERIEAVEPLVRAWSHIRPTAEADAARAHDTGVPFAAKDIFESAGDPTEYGTPAFAGNVGRTDAEGVARLRGAGRVLLGKTATTEYGYGDPAPTRNPWDLSRTPGGSSSGSGAAVAAGMVPLALGTQTSGSVLRPAAYCGVVGFKPSFGLIPTGGMMPLAPSIDTVGVLARSIADVRAGAEVLAGGLPTSNHPIRRAVVPIELVCRATKETVEHLAVVLSVLDDLGIEVEHTAVGFDVDELLEAQADMLSSEAATAHEALVRPNRLAYGPQLKACLARGRAVSVDALATSTALRAVAVRRFDELLGADGCMVLPTVPDVAPVGIHTGDPSLLTLFTWAGLPAVTLPTGLARSGMPFGMQFVGQRRCDTSTLDLAELVARSFGVVGFPPMPRAAGYVGAIGGRVEPA